MIFSSVLEIAGFDCASNWIETTYGTLKDVRIAACTINELIEYWG